MKDYSHTCDNFLLSISPSSLCLCNLFLGSISEAFHQRKVENHSHIVPYSPDRAFYFKKGLQKSQKKESYGLLLQSFLHFAGERLIINNA
jgi:hypothetical protein